VLQAVLLSMLGLVPVGVLPQRSPVTDEAALVFVTATPAARAACPNGGRICFHSPDHSGPLVDPRHGTIQYVARGARNAGGGFVPSDEPWRLDLLINFAPRNLRGAVILIAYDADDAQAIANRETTRLWNMTLDPFAHVAVRLTLDPNGSGFRRGHTYLLRAVQLLGSREKILAHGTVRLE